VGAGWALSSMVGRDSVTCRATPVTFPFAERAHEGDVQVGGRGQQLTYPGQPTPPRRQGERRRSLGTNPTAEIKSGIAVDSFLFWIFVRR